MPHEIKEELCDKCGDCIEACPKKAIYRTTYTSIFNKIGIDFDEDLCDDCHECEDVCPNEAIWHWYYR